MPQALASWIEALARSRPALIFLDDLDRADEGTLEVLWMLAERLADLRLPDGARPTIVELPMPEPQFHRGERLPASYANFLIANGVVLVPVFICARDAEALDVLHGCFPDREVVGIDCRDIVVGLGTLHCLSQQVPAAPAGGPDLQARTGSVARAATRLGWT